MEEARQDYNLKIWKDKLLIYMVTLNLLMVSCNEGKRNKNFEREQTKSCKRSKNNSNNDVIVWEEKLFRFEERQQRKFDIAIIADVD